MCFENRFINRAFEVGTFDRRKNDFFIVNIVWNYLLMMEADYN